MRLLIPCMKCVHDSGAPRLAIARVEVRDDGRYELTCPNGHKAVTLLQQQKFEVLFDIGAYAILDGYYREAVSSFAASLERFYEFAIHVFLHNSGVPGEVVSSCWKEVSRQSERQLGAFVLLWASFFHSKPELLGTKRTEFRNDVVHKGKIPSKSEALSFGNAVLDILRKNMLQLRGELGNSVQRIVVQRLHDMQVGQPAEQPSTMCANTIVSLSAGEASHHQGSLEQHLAELQNWRSLLGASGV